MVLNNVLIFDGETTHLNIASATHGELKLNFIDAIAFPGLINSHDHLDFNLFPQFGDRLYGNYTEWGKYIHYRYKKEITGILKIPENLRTQWGIYKNLLSGVATVVNHGQKLELANMPITVYQNCQNLHSVKFESNWEFKLNFSKKRLPAVIHAGEGTDVTAHKEIDELIHWNVFKKKLIGVHGVAMSADQAKKFSALIWCPESNYFLLNKTADILTLKKYTPILFGTDSTLTSRWNIWEHIRLARKTQMLTDTELYLSLTINPVRTWKINNDRNVVVAKRKANFNFLDSFFQTDPENLLLVVCEGNIRLFDESLLPQLSSLDISQFSKIYINKVCKHVSGNLPELMNKIKEFNSASNFPVVAA